MNVLLLFSASSNSSFNKTNQPPSLYSSTETLLLDEQAESCTKQKEKEKRNEAGGSSSSSSKSNQKSLKINVMRDLKSAQKLKSAVSSTKYTQMISNFNELTTTTNSLSKSFASSLNKSNYNLNNANPACANKQASNPSAYSYYEQEPEQYHANLQKYNLSIDAYSNVKRSQTFTSATLPRNFAKSKSAHVSILPPSNSKSNLNNNNLFNCNTGSDLNISNNNFNNDSLTNSQSSFYNDSRKCGNYQQGIYASLNCSLCLFQNQIKFKLKIIFFVVVAVYLKHSFFMFKTSFFFLISKLNSFLN